jgi:DNA helicase HerA-like ATPase
MEKEGFSPFVTQELGEEINVEEFLAIEEKAENAASVSLKLGSDLKGGRISVKPEILFGRHTAVLGTTGGGKSWSLATMIEEASLYDSKIILFDASGEFFSLQNGVVHLAIGRATHESEKSVSVPYFHLRESDLFGIFKPSGPSQAPKLRSAMQSLKLAIASPILTADGNILKAYRSKVDYERERQHHIAKVESMYNEFDISKLPLQIQNECIDPQRSPTEPLTWGAPNGLDMAYCVSLINRIQDMINSPNLKAIFNPKGMPSLFEEISGFFKDPAQKVLRISLSNLPFEHNTREIVANAIGRHLLEMARRGKFSKKPTVVVLDEAHQFLNQYLKEKNEHYPLDSFGLIAKEGRKYALNIILSTQRPRDIPEDVLSQVGVYLIHRLTNEYDLNVVERAAGTISRDTMKTIPTLLPGEAVYLGVNIEQPVLLRVDSPKNPPLSRGPDYQKYWKES